MKKLKILLSLVVIVVIALQLNFSVFAVDYLGSSIYFDGVVQDGVIPLGEYYGSFQAYDFSQYIYMDYELHIDPPSGNPSSNPRSGISGSIVMFNKDYYDILMDFIEYYNNVAPITVENYFLQHIINNTAYYTTVSLVSFSEGLSSNGATIDSNMIMAFNKAYYFNAEYEGALGYTFFGSDFHDVVCGTYSTFSYFRYFYN